SIILPAAFVGHIVFFIFPGDEVVVVAPLVHVHGMDESAARVCPTSSSGRTESIRSKAVEVWHRWIEVGISGHMLPRAIDEELIDSQTLRSACFEDAAAKCLPFHIETHATTDNDLVIGSSCIGDRVIHGTGIFWSKDKRFR